MKYNMVLIDQEYQKKIEEYYLKYYKDKLELRFDLEDSENILIADNENEKADLYLGRVNDTFKKEISKYQNMDDFFGFLICLTEEDFKIKKGFKVISLLNAVSSAGATTLGLNLSDILSRKGKTMYLSLEKNPSLYFYLEQKINISINDFIFYMNQEPSVIEKKLLNITENLLIIDQSDHFEDIKDIDCTLIRKIIKIAEKTGFNYLVIDFDNLYDLFQEIKSEKYILINHSINNYSRLYFHIKNLDTIKLIINNRDRDLYINESLLRVIDKFYYIDKDYECFKDDKKWKSKIIQTQLEMILKDS